MAWQKATAQTVIVTFYSGGVPTAPTGALTATISKDGAGFATIAGSIVQVAGTECALLTLTAADTNCDAGAVRIVDGGAAVDVRIIEFSTEAAYTAVRAEALDEVGGGTGANTVTVTVRTAGGTVYEGVKVSVTNQAETTAALVVYTNVSGQAVFYLDAGAWRAIVPGDGAQAGGATNFTVDGAEAVTVTVVANTIPATTDPDNYLIYGYARKAEADAAFGSAGMTVTVVDLPDQASQYDATANATRHIMGTAYSCDANGLWSFEVAKAIAGKRIRLRFTWSATTPAGTREEDWEATVLASAANASDQIAWADLTPTLKS